jgi:hypothetical protein
MCRLWRPWINAILGVNFRAGLDHKQNGFGAPSANPHILRVVRLMFGIVWVLNVHSCGVAAAADVAPIAGSMFPNRRHLSRPFLF